MLHVDQISNVKIQRENFLSFSVRANQYTRCVSFLVRADVYTDYKLFDSSYFRQATATVWLDDQASPFTVQP